MAKITAVAIWWVDPKACEALGDELPKDISLEVRKEYRSRLGRAGRCRLWIPSNVTFDGIDPWPDNPFTRWLEMSDYAGIVVGLSDAVRLREYPGVVTRTDLVRQ